MIRIGFTGTHHGMTVAQIGALRILLGRVDIPLIGWRGEFHQGCCVGADEQSNEIATTMGFRTIGHPPTNKKLMSNVLTHETREPAAYLKRNRVIVAEANQMITAPWTYRPPLSLRGQGTWWTILHAMKVRKQVTIINPDGVWKRYAPGSTALDIGKTS